MPKRFCFEETGERSSLLRVKSRRSPRWEVLENARFRLLRLD